MAGDAAVGEKIGRVGKNGIETAFSMFGGDGIQEQKAITVIKAEEWGSMGENQVRSGLHRGAVVA